MGDCCEKKKRDEMIQFVKQKARNFKEMLLPLCKSPESQEFLKKYDDSHVENLTKVFLAPLYSTNTLHIAKDAIVANLNIDDEATKEKIGRYLQCFCECLLV